MSELIEPYTFSQFLIDTYYETDNRREFIDSVSMRYPKMDREVIETFWHVIDFMSLGANRKE